MRGSLLSFRLAPGALVAGSLLACVGSTRAARMDSVIDTFRADLEQSRQAFEAVVRSTSPVQIEGVGARRWQSLVGQVRLDLGEARATLDELERAPEDDELLNAATDRLTAVRNAIDSLRELSLGS